VPNESEEPPASRPPLASHLISPAQIPDWLADSAIKRVTYHRTSALAADSIVKHGVDIERSERGAYGQGFYTATRVDDHFGDTVVPVAIRIRQPLIGSIDEVARVVDQLGQALVPRARGMMTRAAAAAVRRELVRLGYDGLIVFDGGGDGSDYVVALIGEVVKVVVQT
jgi:hypothetical protein